MNAKDRLRLYLEQRRELGESELVLDSLPVDAVLRMIGAPHKTSVTAATVQPRATSASPGMDAPPESQVTDANESRATVDTVATPAESGSAQEVSTPVEPTRRFTETASTDWRSALRDLSPGAATSPSVVAEPFPQWLIDLGIPSGLTAHPLTESVNSAVAAGLNSLDEVAASIATCRACSLGALAINPVPGEGNPDADFLCVGEAPGQTEDETGRPFVGAAGQLLTKILAAIKLSREGVFICNVLKHRPPGNRNPAPEEVRACTPFLTKQIALVKPRVILALGTFAAQTLLNTTTPVGKLRGQVHRYQGVPLIVTYHPSALLRNESWKRPTWEDVQLARRILDAARQASGIS